MSKTAGQCIYDEQFGFFWGIPLTIMAFLISLVGMVVWILGMLVTLICPCFMRGTILVEVAAELVRAPLYTTECFTGSKRLPAYHCGLSGDLPLYSYYTL